MQLSGKWPVEHGQGHVQPSAPEEWVGQQEHWEKLFTAKTSERGPGSLANPEV